MKEEVVSKEEEEAEDESLGSGDGNGALNPEVRDVLVERAEAEAKPSNSNNMATNPMEEDSLIRALEDEQQFCVAPETLQIPVEVIPQQKHGEENETCVSSVTDALRDADLFVDRMYPTLQDVPEEHKPQPMVDLAAERTQPRGISTSSQAEDENTEQEVASLPKTHPVEDAKGIHLADIEKLNDEGAENSNVEQQQPKAEDIMLVGEDSENKEHQHLMEIATGINEAAKMEKLAKAATANTNDDDDVPFNEPEAAFLGRDEQDTVPGNTVEAPTAVEPVPQPALYRTTQMNPQSQPGAFMGAPGRRMQRNPSLNYDLLSANNLATTSGQEDSSVGTAARILTTQGLVQANAIEDDTADLMHANPVDMETAQHRALQQKHQQMAFFAAALWLLLVVAIIVGFVVGTQKTKEPDVVFLESTETPTVYGSMEPSEVPSSAPTGALDILLYSLPDYAVTSINNGSETPQWRAWQWLANHQNNTFLPEWRKTQLFALATFFYAFEGENWWHPIKDRWMDDTVEECMWFSSGFGFVLDGSYQEWPSFTPPCNSQGQFTSLDLAQLQLSGPLPYIPPEITLMAALTKIALLYNGNSGPVSSLLPTEVYEMTDLRSLGLRGNLLTGQIPSEISLFPSLSELILGQNQLSGQIPSEIALLSSLSLLELDQNDLTSQIPSELGLLTALTELRFNENRLTGPIPSELGLLSSLKELYLYDNLLSGQIPSELWLLTSLNLLRLGDNQFSGLISSEVGLLKSLDKLYLAWNQIMGPIPSELGLLTSLKVCDLFDNWLIGPLPSELGLLTSLGRLTLFANQFTGTIPTEVGMMTSLTNLRLHNNNLTGTLPSQLNALMGLRIYGNHFTGTVPEHLCSFLWCECSLSETPAVTTCADLKEAPPDWPGRFPTRGADVMLNIYTDYFPEETTWLWQKETNVTGIWDTLESRGPLGIREHVHSSLFSVNTGTAYRLIVSDSFGDGIPWITMTAGNETVLYSLVAPEAFSEITIDVLVRADGSFDVTSSRAL
ncbi:unknown protein [Seminavis robusta]|uniref:L domain-like protein n=1 Tax=Seminavis robusta TaxID=568900 RepID=A0A9N8HZZ9_9STRA|nr:unknown protein [Seminavis robusta]|eukprot:Sro2443_g327851.1  (1014) ;mRNA; f:8299-11340